MTAVLDTDVLIDHLRATPQATRLLLDLDASGERLAASTVTKAELLVGLREAERPRAEWLFELIEWIPVTDEVAAAAGRLGRSHRRPDVRVAVADFVVAATAELLGARLLTRNVRHFPMFPGLEPPYAL